MAFGDRASLVEDFTGSGALSANWTSPAFGGGNAWTRISDQAGIAVATAEDRALWTAQQFSADTDVIVTVAVAPTSKLEVLVRSDLAALPTYYKLRVNPTGNAFELRKATGGGSTVVIGTSQVQAVSAGDRVGISCRGTTVEAWYQPSAGAWTLIATATDTSVTAAGYIGLTSGDTTLRVDDFMAGASIASNLPLPSFTQIRFNG